MPRAQCGRGGGAQRGRGAKAKVFASSERKLKPHQQAAKQQQEQEQERGGGGGGGGGGVAPVMVKTIKKTSGLGDRSRALILQMMHELRLQEEADERLQLQLEAGEAAAAAVAAAASSGRDDERSSRPKRPSAPSTESMAALEASLLHGDEEEEEEGDSSDGGDGGSDEEKEEEELDGTFRKAANHLAGAAHESSGGNGSDDDGEEEGDDDEDSGAEEEGEAAAAAAAAAAAVASASWGPREPKKLSQKDQHALLKSLITEEREAYKAEQLATREAAVAAALAEAAAGGGKAKAKGAGAAGRGKLKAKVRVTLMAEKGGAKKLVVLERRKDLEGLFAVAKAKLKIKKPIRAYVAESRDPLANTYLLPDDAVVVVSDKAEPGEGGCGKKSSKHGGDDSTPAAAPPPAAVVDHAAELDLVKEAYKKRTEDRYDDAAAGAAAVGKEAEEARRREGARLKEELERREASAEFGEMRAQRLGLPAAAMRERIIEAVGAAQVVVVEGETGSGKTTQVPQIILDDWVARGKGAECSIICTQPRRISAIGVAERVASERLESVGKTVGYQIRLESVSDCVLCLLYVITCCRAPFV